VGRRRKTYGGRFFGLTAVAVCGLLVLAVWVAFRPKLDMGEWSDYLAPSDQAAIENPELTRMIFSDPDPAVNPPGLDMVYRDQRYTLKGPADVFQLAMNTTEPENPLDKIARHWMQQGMAVASNSNRVFAQSNRGVQYMAESALKIEGDLTEFGELDFPEALLVWRSESQGEPWNELSRAPEAPFEKLLPPLKPGSLRVENGMRGSPGYAVLVPVEAPAPIAFKVLLDDLHRRGWEKFGLFDASPVSGEMTPHTRFKKYVAVLKHKSAPLGCQLIVGARPGKVGLTDSFISLF